MTNRPVPDLLAAWRAAERRWERAADFREVAAAAIDVVRTWLAYQEATLPTEHDEFLLVADDDQRYVGASSGVARVLGYEPDELVGLRIEDVAAPEVRSATPAQFARFVAEGRQEGEFVLVARDGAPVDVRFQARAHHPVPGYHVSRLWPAAGTGQMRRGTRRAPVDTAR